ncbi:MAG: threonine/serine dehydratase, partial [Tissierellaceae bacterium]
MLRLYNFIEARERMRTVTNDTKIIYSEVFSEETGHEVYIKPENLQRTGSFKLRGAYNKIMKLSDEEKKRGVIASSAGNHAQGVAYAAQQLGIKSVIVMPKDAPLIKVDATKNYGAEVVLHGDVYDDAYNKACELQEKEGYVFVHPFDDKDVIEGQGSIGLEILDEINDVDIILVPIGGGGLISGIASAVKQMNPNIKIVGVEPEGAASALAALNCGDVLELSDCNTIADGTAVKRIGNLPFKYIRQYVDEIVTVSD